MGEECVQEIARRAVRGLDAGREQEAKESEDLSVGEAVAVDRGRGQVADQVVLRRTPPFRNDLPEVGIEGAGCGLTSLPVRKAAQHLDRPPLELRVVALREAEDAGDDLDGEVERHGPHELGAPGIDEAVDQLVDDDLYELGAPAGERLVPEAGGDHRSVTPVLLAVHLNDCLSDDLGEDRRREPLAVAQDRRHRLVRVGGERGGARCDLEAVVLIVDEQLRRPGHDGPLPPARGQRRERVPDVAQDRVLELEGVEGQRRCVARASSSRRSQRRRRATQSRATRCSCGGTGLQ